MRIRVVVTDDAGRVGRDQKQVFVHDDPDLVSGFPRWTEGVGASNPVFADIDGHTGDEMIVAGDDGEIHAYRPDGREARGFPVRALHAPFWHRNSTTARSDRIPAARNPFFVGAPVVADLDGNGDLEIAATDFDGNLYAWEHNGRRRGGFGNRRVDGEWRTRAHTENRFSAETARDQNNRMKRGITAPPVAADLDGDGRFELVVSAMDRHLYAFDHRGRTVSGFPVLLVDPRKVDAVDPSSHRITFSANAKVKEGGEIIAPVAAGDVDGDGAPELVVGAQEQYVENRRTSSRRSVWVRNPETAGSTSWSRRAPAVRVPRSRRHTRTSRPTTPDGRSRCRCSSSSCFRRSATACPRRLRSATSTPTGSSTSSRRAPPAR